ncbi:single-stranded DNA-binding protein [Candidatus Falkowbacteria bacterium]|nr:single-stranded DNA-binding protein [Candidatus Falkowbacteria bacterium]
MDLNKAMIIGRLTRDPETRTIPSGQTVTSFSLATNRVWKNAQGQKQEAVDYHNIVAWRKLAEICSQYLRKGSKIYIEGRIQTRSWDGQDGVKRYRTEIVADNMIMLDSKSSAPQSNAPVAPPSQHASPEQIPEIQVADDSPTTTPSSPDTEEVNVEEVPF